MVYVGKNEYKYKRMVMSHMVADTYEELHSMADALGINRKHFQNKPGRPHYDICKSNKKLAISKGATEVSDKVIINVLRKNYGQRSIQ